MKRIGIGLALTALLGLAACGSSDSSGSPKTKNAALPSTTVAPAIPSTTPIATTAAAPTPTTATPATIAPAPTSPTTMSPVAPSTTSAPCVTQFIGKVLKACKPYKTIYYTYFSATSAISGQLSSGAGTTSNTWTEQHFAYASLPTIYVDVALDYADGTKMPTTRFRLDVKSMAEAVVAEPAMTAPTTTTTLPKATPTTTVNLPTTTAAPKTPPCTISWDGTRLVACKAFRELKYQYFDAKGPVGGQLGGTTAVPQTSSNLSSKTYPGTTSVRISVTFADGSAVSNVDISIGATVAAPFSAGPSPTTAPPQPGCDLRVSFGAVSSTCGTIKAYSYQWHNGTGTISGTLSASSPNGWGTIYLGSFAPPKAATGALMTFTFVDGRKTRSVLIPLSQPTATIRAPF